jgi:ferredoxin
LLKDNTNRLWRINIDKKFNVEDFMVFYFTATGNSLYAAKRFDEKPASIAQLINGGDLKFSDASIGVVFPVYTGEPPRIVKEFFKRAKFDTEYLYFIMTYGRDETDCPEWTARLCEKLGIFVDYIRPILMVDNFLPVFDMNEETSIDKKVNEQLEAAYKAVSERKKDIPKATEEGIKLHQQVAIMQANMPDAAGMLDFKSNCIGCGICSKVCPTGSLEVSNGKAVRKKTDCEFCLACIHHCPQKAIGLRMPERNPDARYRNEHISLDEIIEANNQNKGV